MIYKTYMKKIAEILTDHKKSIDGLVANYQGEELHKNELIANMRKSGNYTEKFIKETDANYGYAMNYTAELNKLAESTKGKLSIYLGLIKKQIEDYVNAPINPDFATKITSFDNLGIELTDTEFAILKNDARCYAELRLLNHLGAKRTEDKPVRTIVDSNLDKANSIIGGTEKVSNPYHIDIIPIEDIMESFITFSNEVNTFAESYTGASSELLTMLDGYYQEYRLDANGDKVRDVSEKSYMLAAQSTFAERYSRNDVEKANVNHFVETMDNANNILSETKQLMNTIQTQDERKTVDSILNNASEYINKINASKLALDSAEYANLFLKDDRYHDDVLKALGLDKAEEKAEREGIC